MVKTKSVEMDIILKSLLTEHLQALKFIADNEATMRGLIGILNAVVFNDKEKIVGLVSGIESADQAIKITTKQNFYSGRISLAVLIHGLVKHAGEELERRERVK